MLTIAGCLKDSNSLLSRGCYSGRARHHSGLLCTVWWVFKVNPRQWIPLLGFVPGPEHPLILSAWVLGGFRVVGQLWVCWWFLLFFAGLPLLQSTLRLLSGLLTSPQTVSGKLLVSFHLDFVILVTSWYNFIYLFVVILVTSFYKRFLIDLPLGLKLGIQCPG